jgi:hypothetical protein
MAEDVHGVRGKGTGHTIAVVEQTLLEDFFNMFLKSACLTDIDFYW